MKYFDRPNRKIDFSEIKKIDKLFDKYIGQNDNSSCYFISIFYILPYTINFFYQNKYYINLML